MKSTSSSYLWLIPFISFIGGYFLLAHFYHLDTIQTPSLIGLTVQNAFPLLSDNHLNIRLLAVKQDPDLPEGTIVSQTPTATTSIKPNQTIHVVLSQKPAKIEAPLLLNKHINTIEQELKNRGISNQSYALPSTLPSGTCIGQFPPPGTPLDESKIITYVSADIPKPILIPHFKQVPFPTAVEFLEQQSIPYTITHAGYVHPSHICTPLCTIIDQRPLAYSITTLSAQHPLHMHLHVQHYSP